jgi:hypothetical protein
MGFNSGFKGLIIMTSWEQPTSVFCRVSSNAFRESLRINKVDQYLIINT